MKSSANPYLDVVGWMVWCHRLQQLFFLNQFLLQLLDVVLIFIDLLESFLEIANLTINVLIKLI